MNLKKYLPLVYLLVAIIVSYIVYSKYFKKTTNTITYKSAAVEKGDLISSVSVSGSITSGNNLSITTSATGTVNKVYVKNGDLVKKGQKIAQITLDQDSLQKQTSAWASYLGAKNSLDSAKNKINSLQSTAFNVNQKFINDAVARDLETTDPTYIQENANWLQAENDYKNQANVIAQSQVSLSSAWYSYQQFSSIITSPADGIVSNLSIAEGTLISSSSNTSSSTTTQKLGTIKPQNDNIQAQVTLSEIDATKVNAGQTVIITMDAFPDKTFTGKVLIVDTNGQVSSGVTSYPATIQFDKVDIGNIYPNMGVNAKIITNIIRGVLIAPASSVQTSNGNKIVKLYNSGKPIEKNIEIGQVGDDGVEIISGLNEGDIIVTSSSTTMRSTTGTTTASPFSSFGSGGGAVRIQNR